MSGGKKLLTFKTLMMGTEMVLELSEIFNPLTRLIARENDKVGRYFILPYLMTLIERRKNSGLIMTDRGKKRV
jgi:hypothetical protein